jgi:excisionase family DNA binding protein
VSKAAYSIKGAAEALDRSAWFIQREIQSGRLRAKRQGREYLIPAEAIAAWLDALPDA